MRNKDSVDYRLGPLGLRGIHISEVINTHFHFDYAGDHDAFPNATFHIQQNHYDAAVDDPAFPDQ
jgi:glyoxylase-like metal-dependent hydrolase (beta-lactamase superfamily II)